MTPSVADILKSDACEAVVATNDNLEGHAGFVSWLHEKNVEGGDPAYGNVVWRTLISADRTPSSEFLLGVAEFPAFGTLNRHRHIPPEFYYCLSGSGTVMINGVEHAVSAGAAVFVPGNAEHGVVAGADGLSFAYGFARNAFCDVQYEFSHDQSPEVAITG